ncbi:zinc ABC transporter ATP-binding protein [Synergistales bacterium]|nr:zinc ABC transporter ATP-binding protein [Synergistales bacterium]
MTISVKDASFGYEGLLCVAGLNFTVGSGEYLFIVGENGSGKSTLLSGLLKLKIPLSGSVLTEFPQSEIGYLPQQTAAQKDFPAAAFEVALSGRLAGRGIMPFYSLADKIAAFENLKRLGVSDLSGKCFRELSSGQQRRVLLARALCAAKGLLILDEPTAGLDPNATSELYALLNGLHGDGMTIICVSHDISAAKLYATHVLRLGDGKQLFFGKAVDFIA